MNKKKILVNIFSNWTQFAVTIIIAFLVSPVIVHSLGNENYGIWTLIVSITGYFTVLDFGVNTAVVRYISMYTAKREYGRANAIYNSAFVFFIAIGIIVFITTAIFAYFFKDFFHIKELSRNYLYVVFFVVGTNLALNFIFSVYQATLCGLQNFYKLNVISVTTLIINNIVIVVLLLNGFSLISLSLVQLFGGVLKISLQHRVIRKNYNYLTFNRASYDKALLKQIFSYSVYSFLISIALKILFFTDSVVIGKLISVREVTIYAIPSMLLQYSEKFIYAVVAVLVPVISSNDATGENDQNKYIYVYGSKYSLALSIPLVFVLYTKGSDFISLWMGEEYAAQAYWTLKILVVGYAFSFPQMISQGILKGISKHKVFAYILIGEAVANLVMSVVLVKYMGLEGVALGTAIPLIVVNMLIVPAYTCYVLRMNFPRYVLDAYATPLFGLVILMGMQYYVNFHVNSYYELMFYIIIVISFMAGYSSLFILKKTHRQWIFNSIRSRLQRT